jgi:hypothetical protein
VNTANLRDAGRFLDARGVREAAVLVLPTPGVALNPEVSVPLLDYHTEARLVAVGGPQQAPPPDELRASSFRFSWEAPLPGWYHPAAEPGRDAAFVLISGEPGAPPPRAIADRVAGRAPDAVFHRDAVFRFRTFVSIWLPSPASP